MSELSDPFPPDGSAPAGDDWMQVRIQASPEVGAAVLELLRERFGYLDSDWCVMERRQDYSRVDFDPMPARTKADHDREYTIDWRTP